MDNKRKIILIIAIVVVIIIIILISIILNLNKKEVEPDASEMSKIVENDGEVETNEKLHIVDNRTDYYTIKGIIDEYFSYIRNIKLNPIQYKTKISEEDKQEGMKEELQTAKNAINAFLADEYLEEYPMSDEKFNEIVEKYSKQSILVNEMLCIESGQEFDLYIVNLTALEINESFYIMIRRDKNNYRFEMYLDEYVKEHGYDKKIEGDSFKVDTTEISNKTYNQYTNRNITDAEIADNYFLKYKYAALKDTREAYDLLDEEYRNIRFGSYENYDKYIQDNITDMQNIIASEYLTNNYDEYTEYVCKDQYGNYYKFKATGIMEYTLQLDTYTIFTNKFKEAYDEASNKEKVSMQMEKLVEMINNRDYSTIYKKLDDNFKNNYFNTEEEFAEYMKKNYNKHYTLENGDFSEKGGVYIQKVYLKDIDEDKSAIGVETEFYVTLEKNRDFRLSFNVIRR